MSVEAWAEVARHGKYYQAAEDQCAIATFEIFFQAKIDSDSAARKMASIYEPLLRQRLKQRVSGLWALFCDAVKTLGGQKEIAKRQIDLLDSISKLPDVTDANGNTLQFPGVYWQDLPDFGWIFREYAMDIDARDDMEDNSEWDAQALPLLNATTFAAMKLAHDKKPDGMDFHAEASFRTGIESPCETSEQLRDAVMYVPPAATWILLAGETIYTLCKTDHKRDDGAPGSALSHEDWFWGRRWGYSLERWTFWRERFGEISKVQNLKDDVKEVAARATLEMERIEKKA